MSLLGRWRIVAMPDYDDDFPDMMEPAYIHFGPTRGDWRGWTIERGEVRPLLGFRIVGTGMLRVGS